MSEPGPADPDGSAELLWRDGVPLSHRFDDVYYSREDGLAESRHVFLDGNDLRQRWRQLADTDRFTIFETGFGTGLNFLGAAALWLETAPAGAVLHYVSVEKYPLAPADIHRALERWPQLSAVAAELLENYPPTVEGVHRLWLFDHRICLTLVFDDAVAGLSQLLRSDHPAFRPAGPANADAWFLDGFAPARNPELWSAELFALIPCFCRTGTTLATFTVARAVRDGLAAVGFALEKRPGYGRKREMLCAAYAGEKPPLPDPTDYVPPRVLRNAGHEAPWYLALPERPAGRTVAVIGAGIAGTTTAAALRRRGFEVTLYDRHGAAGTEASGNPQGILYPRLSAEESPLAAFARHALCFSRSFYRNYWRSNLPGQRCGVTLVPESAKEAAQFERISARYGKSGPWLRLLRDEAVDDVAGIALENRLALHFPDLGWVSPPHVCRWLAGDSTIVDREVRQFLWDASDGLWYLLDSAGDSIGSAHQVVIAGSNRAADFHQCAGLPLRPVRGQITALPASSTSSRLATVLCGAGYLAPAVDGAHTLGATYGVDDGACDLRETDHRRNLLALGKTDGALPALFELAAVDPAELDGRAAVRCTTPDYLPVVGPVADEAIIRERFGDLAKNARADIPLPGCFHPGLWITVGHGSRGLTYAPLAAEMLAAQISDEVSPVPRYLATALQPARFIIRKLKRKLLPSR